MPYTANANVVPVTAPAEDLALDHRHSIVKLRDGRAVVVRPVQAADEPAILDFLEHMSLTVHRLRFFSTGSDLRAAAHWATHANGADQFALVALDDESRVVGHAAYARTYGPRAEVAVEVTDDMHHIGLGTHLVTWLAQVAEHDGIAHFVAEVLPDNGEMHAVFRDGFAPIQRRESGVIEIEFPSSSWRLAQRRFSLS